MHGQDKRSLCSSEAAATGSNTGGSITPKPPEVCFLTKRNGGVSLCYSGRVDTAEDHMQALRMLLLLAFALSLSACVVNPYDPAQRAVAVGLTGAAVGAGIGAIAGGPPGAAIGAAIGGTVGVVGGVATTPPPGYYGYNGYYGSPGPGPGYGPPPGPSYGYQPSSGPSY